MRRNWAWWYWRPWRRTTLSPRLLAELQSRLTEYEEATPAERGRWVTLDELFAEIDAEEEAE